MRWMRFSRPGRPGTPLGQVEGDTVRVFEGDLFDQPRPTGEQLPLAGLTFAPPCRPGKIVGLWNNFRAAADRNGWAHPAEPLYFLKSPGSAAAHEQARKSAMSLAPRKSTRLP